MYQSYPADASIIISGILRAAGLAAVIRLWPKSSGAFVKPAA